MSQIKKYIILLLILFVSMNSNASSTMNRGVISVKEFIVCDSQKGKGLQGFRLIGDNQKINTSNILKNTNTLQNKQDENIQPIEVYLNGGIDDTQFISGVFRTHDLKDFPNEITENQEYEKNEYKNNDVLWTQNISNIKDNNEIEDIILNVDIEGNTVTNSENYTFKTNQNKTLLKSVNQDIFKTNKTSNIVNNNQEDNIPLLSLEPRKLEPIDTINSNNIFGNENIINNNKNDAINTNQQCFNNINIGDGARLVVQNNDVKIKDSTIDGVLQPAGNNIDMDDIRCETATFNMTSKDENIEISNKINVNGKLIINCSNTDVVKTITLKHNNTEKQQNTDKTSLIGQWLIEKQLYGFYDANDNDTTTKLKGGKKTKTRNNVLKSSKRLNASDTHLEYHPKLIFSNGNITNDNINAEHIGIPIVLIPNYRIDENKLNGTYIKFSVIKSDTQSTQSIILSDSSVSKIFKNSKGEEYKQVLDGGSVYLVKVTNANKALIDKASENGGQVTHEELTAILEKANENYSNIVPEDNTTPESNDKSNDQFSNDSSQNKMQSTIELTDAYKNYYGFQSDNKMLEHVFDNNIIYLLNPSLAPKRKFLIKGAITGSNKSIGMSNNEVLIKYDFWSRLFKDIDSQIRLSVLGGTNTSIVKYYDQNYSNINWFTGPKFTFLSNNIAIELVGLYNHSQVKQNDLSNKKIINHVFTLGTKIGINCKVPNNIIVQPNIMLSSSYIKSEKKLKNKLDKLKFNISPGLSVAKKITESCCLTTDINYHHRPILKDCNTKCRSSIEVGVGVNKILKNSFEIGAKISADVPIDSSNTNIMSSASFVNTNITASISFAKLL